MSKKLLLPLLTLMICLLPKAAMAKLVFSLAESSTSYRVDHPAHTSVARSTVARGKMECDDQKSCSYLVAIPLKSFDSGSSNRDQHMLDVTKAALHPLVQIQGHVQLPQKEVFEQNLNAEITFAGVAKNIENLVVKCKKDGSK